jgi:hypothetical protein
MNVSTPEIEFQEAVSKSMAMREVVAVTAMKEITFRPSASVVSRL